MAEVLFVKFRVDGQAAPAGSKTAYPMYNASRDPLWKGSMACTRCHGKTTFVRCKSCGHKSRIVIRMADDSKHGAPWRKAVQKAAKIAMDAKECGDPTGAPTRLICRFYQTRPLAHYRTGKNSHLLKDDAPQHVTKKPDLTKLVRAIEDAMTGIVYTQDEHVCSQTASKHYGSKDCVDIEVWVLSEHGGGTEGLYPQ